MKVNGPKENKMVLVDMFNKMENQDMVFGRMEKERIG